MEPLSRARQLVRALTAGAEHEPVSPTTEENWWHLAAGAPARGSFEDAQGRLFKSMRWFVRPS